MRATLSTTALLVLLASTGCADEKPQRIRMMEPGVGDLEHAHVEPKRHDPHISRPYILDDDGNRIYVD